MKSIITFALNNFQRGTGLEASLGHAPAVPEV